MISRAVARRYAQALFELAGEHNVQQPIHEQLTAFRALVHEATDLERLYANPAVQPAKKMAVFEQIEPRLGFDPLFNNFIKLLIRKGRINYLDAIGEVYEELDRQRRGIVIVKLATARPLSRPVIDRLREQLARSLASTVEVETRVDSALIGGIIARVGDTVYDGSIQRQLARIQHRLGEE
jgi:F-type H+-transporting ATPase subunit delta